MRARKNIGHGATVVVQKNRASYFVTVFYIIFGPQAGCRSVLWCKNILIQLGGSRVSLRVRFFSLQSQLVLGVFQAWAAGETLVRASKKCCPNCSKGHLFDPVRTTRTNHKIQAEKVLYRHFKRSSGRKYIEKKYISVL